jgi:hypothetical protein
MWSSNGVQLSKLSPISEPEKVDAYGAKSVADPTGLSILKNFFLTSTTHIL